MRAIRARLLLAAALPMLALSACARDGLDTPSAQDLGAVGDTDDAGAPPHDMAGTVLRLRWSLLYNGRASTCEEAGVKKVGLRYVDHTEILADCAAGGVATGPLNGMTRHPVAWNGDGVAVSYVHLNEPKYYAGGVQDATLVFRVTDEPLPEMRRLFDLVASWYQINGRLPLDWGPGPPGVCCTERDYVCPAELATIRGQAWPEVGFAVGHEAFFNYSFTRLSTNPPIFEIRALADLLCDGRVLSDYAITGTWTGQGFSGKDQVVIKNAGE